MARQEPPTSWALPTATPQKATGLRVALPLRLSPNDSSLPTLWFATRNTTDLIRSSWAHEQQHGGVAEVITWAEGIVIRSIQPPMVPFYPLGDVHAFAAVQNCSGLFLPVGMGLRPAIRAATWKGLRVPKSIQLFDGTRWLFLPHQGFQPLAEIVDVVSPCVQTPLQVWTNSNEQAEDVAQLDATSGTSLIHPALVSVTKAKAGFARHFRQLFSPKEKAATSTKVDAEPKPRATTGSRKLLRDDIVQELLRREQLGTDKETQAWNAVADSYADFDAEQAALARSHAAWLTLDSSQLDFGQGVRAVWLVALEESRRRGGDTLYLATVYDQLLHRIEDGLDRVHDLPAFLWPRAGDPVEALIELHGLFLEHGPLRSVGAALGGILFALAALNCHEPRLAKSWLAEARDMLKELRHCATTHSVLVLCEAAQRRLRIRIAEPDEFVELPCPKIAVLARRCQSFGYLQQRLQQPDPESSLYADEFKFSTVDQHLQDAEQERTAAVLPGIVFRLGAGRLCRTREEVGRWVALVPDAIELQAEFWRTRWPGESQSFDVQVRWSERLIRWALEDSRRLRLEITDFLDQLFAMARERDTPLRLALAQREWDIARCIVESGKTSLQKQWIALGVLSQPSALLLRGRNREARKALDDLMRDLAEAPLETPAKVRTANAIFSACFLLPQSQVMERGRHLIRSITERLTQHGDEDVFAWRNLVTLDRLLSTLFATPPTGNEQLLAWISEDEQRIRKRMARDLALMLADVN